MMPRLDLSMVTRRRVVHIRQNEVAECGLACIAMVAGIHGLKVDLNTLRRDQAPSVRGSSLRDLISIADRLGFTGRPVKIALEDLHGLKFPAILHWDMNHYVVLERVHRGYATICDPAQTSTKRIALLEVSEHFTGIALELRPADSFKPVDRRHRLKFWQLWAGMDGWKRVAAQTFVLTIILQTFTLASPYYMQIAVDRAIPTLDTGLLGLVAIAFGLLTLFNALATLLRGFVLLSAGATIGFAITTNLGRHLFRLPISWFERRDAGDLLSRFQAVHPIQDALTQGVVSSLVDGGLTVLTLALMIGYNWKLALVAIIAFFLYALVRSISFPLERQARESMIEAIASEQTTMMETVRGISTLRLFGREIERHLFWQDKLSNEFNTTVGVARVALWQSTLNTLIFGLENVATVWLAMRMVINGGLSVGMVVAYIAYKQQFLTRSASLVDQAISFRMLGLYLDRLGDIALQKEDIGFNEAADSGNEFSGRVELRNIRYRYSSSDPWVLDGLSLELPAGSHIAITGPSGGGKSTLAKVILGLDHPEEGQILIDGDPLQNFGYRHYRSQVAGVLQDDNLFAGSISDNITLFENETDMDRVIEVARLSSIHDEIVAMPMKYNTLVGDMGSSLSGGQKARVLLARALYHRPKLLVLDEGTAHLDPKTESVVNRAVAGLGITRVVIAHRSETIRNASIVLTLIDGRLCRTHDSGGAGGAASPSGSAVLAARTCAPPS